MNTELLALLIEVISIQVAGKQIKKPITGLVKSVTPRKPNARPEPTRSPADTQAAFQKGLAVLSATSRTVRRA